MNLFFAFLNIILLYLTFAGIIRKTTGASGFIKHLGAFATTVLMTGFFYYASLVLSISFSILLLILSVLNAVSLWLLYRGVSMQQKVLASGKIAADPRIAFFVVLAVFLFTFEFAYTSRKWGEWDAWAIWSLHAKFLFYPDYWSNLFTDKIAFTHPDYPLMLPALIAYCWRGVGTIAPFIPYLIAYVILLAVPLTIFRTIYQQGNDLFAFIALFIFIADIRFVYVASSQYADTWVAFFILIAFILYKQIRSGASEQLVYLLGFIAAGAGWVKNEGMLFYIVFTGVFMLFNYRKPVLIIKYLVGSALPLAAIASFKLLYAPQNDLLYADRKEAIKSFLVQGKRYQIIALFFIKTVTLYFTAIILLVIYALIRKINPFKSFYFVVVLLVVTGYFFVYVTTPNELNWHLESSADRLFHHLYPAVVCMLLWRIRDSYAYSKPLSLLSLINHLKALPAGK